MRWTRFKNGSTSLHAINEEATGWSRGEKAGSVITVCGRDGFLSPAEEDLIIEDAPGYNSLDDQPRVCILCLRRLGMTIKRRESAAVRALLDKIAEEQEKRAQLVKALHVAVVEMHPMYGNTTGPYGGIGGAAMTPWCHMIMDAPPGAGWDAKRLMVESVLREQARDLEEHGVEWDE